MTDRSETRAQKVKRITLRNTILTFIGYSLHLGASYVGKFLNLTSCSYRQLNLIVLLIVVTIALFCIFIKTKKEISYKLSQWIGIAQLLNMLLILGLWLFFIQELRGVALFSVMIPFIFFFSVGTVLTSIVIAILFMLIYLAIAYYSIYYMGQDGSFLTEAFFCFCFAYTVLFLIGMTDLYQKQRMKIKLAKADSEKAKKEIEKSNTDISRMYNNITKMVEEIYSLSEQVARDSDGISKSSERLLTGSIVQVEAIRDIAETMSQINEQTSANARNAVKANELTLLTKASSRNGVQQMQEVNDAIIDINQSSQSISKIIGKIDSISFQTNLLALNAAVEAARAGKHGKGFSVVAQEVRNLALKSADAANETTELIEQSLIKVDTGTKTSETAVNALDDINEKIAVVTSLVKDISDSSNIQTTSISQVNASMVKISDITNSTAASAKQTNVTAWRLASAAEKIHHLLQQFDTENKTANTKHIEN